MKEKPILRHMNEKILLAPFRIYEERNSICRECYAYSNETCKVSGEPITARSRMKSGACPMGFWSSHYGD